MDVFYSMIPKPYYYYTDIFTAVLGISCVWLSYDRISYFRNISVPMPKFTSYTFFVYLYHVPAITVLHKLFVFVFGANIVGYGLGYILPPPSIFNTLGNRLFFKG